MLPSELPLIRASLIDRQKRSGLTNFWMVFDSSSLISFLKFECIKMGELRNRGKIWGIYHDTFDLAVLTVQKLYPSLEFVFENSRPSSPNSTPSSRNCKPIVPKITDQKFDHIRRAFELTSDPSSPKFKTNSRLSSWKFNTPSRPNSKLDRAAAAVRPPRQQVGIKAIYVKLNVTGSWYASSRPKESKHMLRVTVACVLTKRYRYLGRFAEFCL
jgi:hypothetical protein